MSNIIANEHVFVGFTVSDLAKEFGFTVNNAPTLAEIGLAVDLTDYLITLTASSQGNSVPTPRLSSLFETSIPGTAAATFTADFYRDDAIDLAWDTLQRGTKGTFVISRFGGTGPGGRPAATQKTELWPVIVISAAAGALQSGTAQTFTMTGSVPLEPAEHYVVPAV